MSKEELETFKKEALASKIKAETNNNKEYMDDFINKKAE